MEKFKNNILSNDGFKPLVETVKITYFSATQKGVAEYLNKTIFQRPLKE